MRHVWEVAAALIVLLVVGEAWAQTNDIHERDDSFRPYREVFTGQHRVGGYPNLIGLRLVGRLDRKSGALSMQLEVEFAYMSDHKRGYHTARNNRAEALRFTALSSNGRCRTGSSCPYGERFVVDIPEGDLRQASPNGYQLKLFARNGPEALVTMPKGSIARLLEHIDALRRVPADPKPAKAAVR
jgi:hypothetical protein